MSARNEPLIIGAAAAAVVGGLAFFFLMPASSVSKAPGPPVPGTAKGHPAPAVSRGSAVGPRPGADARAVEVLKTYSGVCSMEPKNEGGRSGPVTSFPVYHPDDLENELIRHIPKSLPSKTNPAAANPDRLLGKPDLDLGKNMALVLLRPGTLGAMPIVRSIREDADKIWVEAEHPATPPDENCPDGMGAYTVVVIPFSGEPKELSISIGAH